MARGNSKSIPNKNIINLNGFPLIAWSISACKLSKKINEIIVSTDSKKIGDIARKYGANVPFYRPAKYARDNSTDYEAFRHFIDWWDLNNSTKIEMIVQIRPTTPFRDPSVIDRAIETFKRKDCTGLRSVFEMSETSWKTFEINKKKYLTPLTKYLLKNKKIHGSNLPRQSLPKTYFGQGYVDIVKPEILKGGETYGKKIFAFITPDIGELDTKKDLEKIRNNKNFKTLKIFKYLCSSKNIN